MKHPRSNALPPSSAGMNHPVIKRTHSDISRFNYYSVNIAHTSKPPRAMTAPPRRTTGTAARIRCSLASSPPKNIGDTCASKPKKQARLNRQYCEAPPSYQPDACKHDTFSSTTCHAGRSFKRTQPYSWTPSQAVGRQEVTHTSSIS